ncbi:MAG: HRDC domain-containing protein [Gemmatimonadota bacterium]
MTRQDEADRLFAELSREPMVAVDTEAASFHRFHDRIYLVQVSSRTRTAVLDPLTIGDLGGLGRLLSDPGIEILFHDADYDLRILDRDYGFQVHNVFDTKVAAELLNEPGIGLAALLGKYLAVTLDKKYQRADWSRRPLSPEMLAYAAADTMYLPTLRDLLAGQLKERGRWSWAEDEFVQLEGLGWNEGGPKEEAFLRLKGAKTLKGRALAVLRELYAWREETASQLDRATFRVLGNESLMALAVRQPADMAGLQGIPGLSPDAIGRRGPELLAAVARGMTVSLDSLPVIERGHRQARDPEFELALERLKVARNAAAERIGLATGVLCPNGILEGIARLRPRTVEALATVPGIRRWQVGVLGEELLAALTAPATA